jgi:CDP-glycerol glycerophosphotransferase (TagB/SpsB family)
VLEQYLNKHDIKIQGFIDKNKNAKNIYKLKEIVIDYDYIFILSPNHHHAIYAEFINHIAKESLVKVDIKNGNYKFETNPFIEEKRKFFYIPKEIEIDRKKIVFISKSLISANNKALYLYCYKNKIDTKILTDNKEQLEELEKHNLPCILLDTKEADYEIAIARFLVFDQGNYTYLPTLHPSQKTVQLWHGVGLKKMSKIDNITYDYFVSTSKWTNKTNFENIFSAEKFLTHGYPRNDIFFKQEEDRDFLFCDEAIKKLIAENKDNKIILYAPTHRESNTKIAFDFELLNKELEKKNAIFIVKLHPFVLEYYTIHKEKEYSNIFFHNAYGDIYPLLKYVDILVSDYSSIVYDFLLLNKPIIFYIYDINEYIKNVSLLFDYDEYSPGIKVYTQNELLKALNEKDIYQEEREKIRDKFFEEKKQIASKNILDAIFENNNKAKM